MSQLFETRGKNGLPETILVIVGMGEARDLGNWLPETAYKAWVNKRIAERYDRVVASWRAQRTFAVTQDLGIAQVPVEDTPEPQGNQQ